MAVTPDSVLDRVLDVELACRACGADHLVPGRWSPPRMASWGSRHRAARVTAYTLLGASPGVRPQRVELPPAAPPVLRR